MKDPIVVAAIRGLYTAVGMAGATFLGALYVDVNLTKAGIMAGIAFFASLGFRGGIEGTIDQKRAKALPPTGGPDDE